LKLGKNKKNRQRSRSPHTMPVPLQSVECDTAKSSDKQRW
jgi:hypothetical protein